MEVAQNNFATIRTTSIVRQEIKQHERSNELRNFTVYKRLRKMHQKELQSVGSFFILKILLILFIIVKSTVPFFSPVFGLHIDVTCLFCVYMG